MFNCMYILPYFQFNSPNVFFLRKECYAWGYLILQNLHNSLSPRGRNWNGGKSDSNEGGPSESEKDSQGQITFTFRHLGEEEGTCRGGLKGHKDWQLLLIRRGSLSTCRSRRRRYWTSGRRGSLDFSPLGGKVPQSY